MPLCSLTSDWTLLLHKFTFQNQTLQYDKIKFRQIFIIKSHIFLSKNMEKFEQLFSGESDFLTDVPLTLSHNNVCLVE